MLILGGHHTCNITMMTFLSLGLSCVSTGRNVAEQHELAGLAPHELVQPTLPSTVSATCYVSDSKAAARAGRCCAVSPCVLHSLPSSGNPLNNAAASGQGCVLAPLQLGVFLGHPSWRLVGRGLVRGCRLAALLSSSEGSFVVYRQGSAGQSKSTKKCRQQVNKT
eukprot:m.280210 g.280210  ORF g.280210 m.280210 type:complete len:165 (+) comp19396_c0_seq4:141-635(+)